MVVSVPQALEDQHAKHAMALERFVGPPHCHLIALNRAHAL